MPGEWRCGGCGQLHPGDVGSCPHGLPGVLARTLLGVPPTIRVDNEFGGGQVAFTEAAVRELLTWAVALADDRRRWLADPLNQDWEQDVESLASAIGYAPPARGGDTDDDAT
jgi:hypothetical protein